MRRPIFLPTAATLLLACVAARASEDGRPVLRLEALAHVRVDAERVTLRDVVTVVQDDDDVAGRLLGLDLGPAPRVGLPAHLRQSQVADWVRACRPGAAVQVRWSGAADIDVERASQALSGQDFEDVARPALDAWLAKRSESHAIELAQPLPPVAVPLGHVALDVRPLPRLTQPSSHATVWVDVSVGGHFQRSVNLEYRVQAFRTGWVAAQELQRGQDIDTSRLTQALVDVARLPAPLWKDTPDRARMRRAVHPGEALTTLDAEARPWVVRGERVEVFSRVGELSIEAQAEALQDGRAGQDVLVRIASSRSPVTARVLKPGLVEIRQ
ncbi:MAG TPA: flagellar basal body P-ring formation chaperone FlgA [Burkholderiaceae bacterium]